MNNPYDGGPAFPSIVDRDTPLVYEDEKLRVLGAGMSLRDYFAAAALTGVMTDQADPVIERDDQALDYLASRLYKMADAMIDARKQP